MPPFISTEIICTTNSECTVDLTSIIRFVFPKSIMAFLLSKLRLEILEFHKSCDVYQTRCVKCFLIVNFFLFGVGTCCFFGLGWLNMTGGVRNNEVIEKLTDRINKTFYYTYITIIMSFGSFLFINKCL